MDMEKTKKTDNQSVGGGKAEGEFPAFPPIAVERYKGQNVYASVAGRTTLLGAIGYGLGTLVGNIGDRPVGSKKHLGLSPRFWQFAIGGAFAFIGANSASRDARESELQHLGLQKAYRKLYSAYGELHTEYEHLSETAHHETPANTVQAEQAVHLSEVKPNRERAK